MFGKLLKYDFKSMLKSFIPMWIAFIVLAVINRLTGGFVYDGNSSGTLDFLSGLMVLLYVGLLVGINVMGVVLIIQRFYSGLLKDEGYLTFTLPTKPWVILTSKGVCGTIILIINAVISVISVMILASTSELFTMISNFMRMLGAQGGDFWLVVVLAVIAILLSTIGGIYHIYASLALGHLANKRRIGWAVAAYIGLSFILTALAALASRILEAVVDINWLDNAVMSMGDLIGHMVVPLILVIVSAAVQLVIYHVITERILSKKLNLE